MNQKILMRQHLEDLVALPAQKSKRKPRLTPVERMAKKEEDQRRLNENIGKMCGFLTIVGIEPKNGKHVIVRVRCVCDTEKVVRLSHLGKSTKSCGCKKSTLRTEKVSTHGHYIGKKASKTMNAYHSMISRCYREKDASYPLYHSRGITVCDRWRFGESGESGFICFLNDMGNPPSKKHSIDRINNDGNYRPENCRWATPKEQSANRSCNKTLTLKGETKTLIQWCEEFKWPHSVIWSRLQTGWSDEEILTTPPINSIPPLDEIKPWEKMGISKSTWRRNGNNKNTLIAEYCRRTSV